MAKTKRLKKYILEALRNTVMTIDEVVDFLAYPVIEKAIIEPITKMIPTKEIDPQNIRDEILRIFTSIIEPVRKHKAPLPVALLILGGMILSFLPTLVQALMSPMLQSWITHPANSVFRPTLLSPMEILEAYRRGIIKTKEERDKFLAWYGLSTFLIDVAEKLQWYIPTASDIIRFGVREVYTEDVVKKFRMDEGFDDVVKSAKDDMQAAGLSEDTFRKYWRAHWELPSFTQGTEMFHRGIISYNELKMLLKALDVMPFWQDKLIQLTYAIPTRVDLRRMHKLKLISDSELVSYYKKLGYTEEDAKKLAEFTIKYNEDPEWTERTREDEILFEYRNKAKSEIIQAYKEHIIDEKQCREQLKTIGLTEQAVEYEIAFAEYDRRRDIIKDYVSVLTSKYIKGLLDENTLRSKLAELNLPNVYIEHLINVSNIKALEKPLLPTKADIIDWYKKQLIDEKTTRNLLKGLGYDDIYVELYIKEADFDIQKKAKSK